VETLRRLRDASGGVLIAVCAVMIMLFPGETGQGISDGIALCTQRIVPSVFPMMIVCVLAVECGFAARAGRYLAPLSRRLFGLPGEGATAIFLSMIGGYPAGARTVVELYENGSVTRAQAAHMALFCFCSGPAFLIGVIGGLTGSAAAGWILMGVQAVVVVLMGVIVCRGAMGESDADDGSKCRNRQAAAEKPLTEAVVSSVSKSASAVLQVCLYVMIFSAVNAVFERMGADTAVEHMIVRLGFSERIAGAIMPAVLEVTSGCIHSLDAGLPMTAFAVGFGGMSVHLQVLAITERLGVNKGLFFLMRIVQGAMSALLTWVVLGLVPDGGAIAASAQLTSPGLSGSPQGAVVLVVMCAVYVLCVPVREGRILPETRKIR